MPGRFSFSTRNAVSLPSVRPIAPSTILSTVREGILANGRERVKRRNPANLLHWIAFFERVRMRTNVVLAEPEGFEPSVRLYIVQRFSKPPPSATRPQLRRGGRTIVRRRAGTLAREIAGPQAPDFWAQFATFGQVGRVVSGDFAAKAPPVFRLSRDFPRTEPDAHRHHRSRRPHISVHADAPRTPVRSPASQSAPPSGRVRSP